MKGEVFCPRCGKTGEKLFHGLCRSCFIEDFSLISIPDEINITTCTQCGSIQKKGRWYDSNLTVKDQAAETILEHVEVPPEVSNLQIVPELGNILGSTFEFIIKVKGDVLGEKISQEFLVKVKVKKNVCNECSKFASGYYEAVIQLRADERTPSPEEIQKADDILKNKLNTLLKDNRMAYISEKVEIKEGIDYYIGSYKAARKLTESLKNGLGGLINESPRLMGHDKSRGKDLFRIWILLRLPNFFKGDFVRYNDLIGQIISFDGNKIYLKILDSDQRLSLPWKASGKLEVVARKEDVKIALTSAKSPEYIQILHPETYQPLDIPTTPEFNDVQIGEEVEVVEINSNFYLLNKKT